MIKALPILLSFIAASGRLSADATPTEGASKNTSFYANSAVNSCNETLNSLVAENPPPQINVFELFNEHPPSEETYIDLIDTDIKSKTPLKIPGICLARPPFEFTVHEDGKSRESRETDFIPIKLWKINEGYQVIYLYKNEQAFDSGADSIILALAQYDKFKKLEFYIKELSSWYEYEDAVRIRKAKITADKIFKTESLYNRNYQSTEGQIFSFHSNTPEKEIPVTIEATR